MHNMDLNSTFQVYSGTVIDTTEELPLNIQECVLGVQEGQIIFRENVDKIDDLKSNFGFTNDDIIFLTHEQFLMPGLVDIHLHAPQYHFSGTNMSKELLPWLEFCTFPAESKFTDLKFANDVFSRVVRDTLNNGTTTAVYFSSLHIDASLLLSDVVEKYGQRAYIGKVSMDSNSPEFYKEITQEAMQDAEIFIVKLQNKQNELINPIVTPRFAPVCTSQLLQFLGSLAKTYDTPVQSHLAENKDECDLAKTIFPDCNSYAEIYDKFNLLTPTTVMAHGIYLSNSDIELLRTRGSGIAHCPNSNISLKSGLCDVRKLFMSKVKLGLGTDVAGGYSTSILDSIRQAILTSKIISMSHPNYQVLTYQEAFRMATLGGCEILGISDKLGTLQIGKQFDALLVDVSVNSNALKYFPHDVIEDTIEKFFHHGDDRNIQKVYVNGKQVK
uniref:Guanine deaminase n=1 Tax=Strigamia maritima TaxID=126957 RepID=T1JIQ3_STRMM